MTIKQKLKIIILLVLIGTAASVAFGIWRVKSAPSRAGLVGWWTMDTNDMSSTGATMYDKSGLGNNGTVIGTTTSTGRIKEARSFNGSTDYISASDAQLPSGNSNRTVSAWVTTQTGQNQYYFSYGSPLANQTFAVGIYNNHWVVTQWGANAQGTSNPADGNWHHVVWVWNGSSPSISLYVDGNAEVVTVEGSFAVNTTLTGTFEIGRIIGGGYEFNGLIDDVHIYNRALSAQEVSNLYNSVKQNYITLPPRAGLVGWWTMDTNDMSSTGATMYDKSGLGNNGTVTGTTTSTGRIKEARSFNGSTDYIELVGTEGSYSFPQNTGIFTFSGWMQLNDYTADACGAILGAGPSSAQKGSAFMYDNRSGVVDHALNLWLSRGTGGSWVIDANSSANIITDNGWHHVAAIGNGTSVVFYVDGVANAPADTMGTKSTGDSSLAMTIGKRNYSSTDCPFHGSIDDVRIYNDALSAQEVSNLYNSAKQKYTTLPPRAGLVGWWTMDTNDMSSTGATMYDKSGLGNNGTVTGTTTSTGKIGQARSFNGTSDYISMGDVLDFEYNLPFSISVWFKNVVSPTAGLALVNKHQISGEPYRGYGVYIRGDLADDPLEFSLYSDNAGGELLVQRFARPNDTQWHHVVATYDGSTLASGAKMYLDGVALTPASTTDSLGSNTIANAINFEIGGREGANQVFTSSIDDVRIYNRALSAQEVSQLYNSARVNYIR